MSEAQALRDRAAYARELAHALTDARARAALEALAREFEQLAVDLDRQEKQQGAKNPPSRGDTP